MYNIFCRELSALILIGGGASLCLAIEERLAVLVDAELGNNNLRRVNADIDGGSIYLLAGDPLHVDDPFLTVDLDYFTLATLVGATYNLNFVVLADRHGPDVVLGSEVSGERRAHDNTAKAGRRREVSLSALAPRGGHSGIEFHSSFFYTYTTE